MAVLLALALASCGGGGGSVAVQENPPVQDDSSMPPASEEPAPSNSDLPVIQLRAGAHTIDAEVASTAEDRETGLMFREALPEDAGMLFVFSEPTGICMWMQNTYIPLSVAFLDQNGVILNIEDMQPETTEFHCSIASARYALEMNQGWFGQNNIGPGSRITGLP